MQRMHRAGFRALLRMKLRRSTDAAEKTAVEKTLADKDLFESVLDGADEEYASDPMAVARGDGKFLKFIFDNWATILQMIKDIISLFSPGPV